MEKEVLVSKYKSITLNVTANKIDSYRRQEEQMNTVRVYGDGKIGIAGSLGELDEKALTEEAEKALGYGIQYPCKLNSEVKTIDRTKEIIPVKDFIPKMQHLLDRIAEECPKFAASDKIYLTHSEDSYKNSKGAELFTASDVLNVNLIFQNKGSGNLFDCGFGTSVTDYDEDMIVSDCKKMHDAFYVPVDIGEGEYPVFFMPDDIFGVLGRHFFATFYASGGSLLSGKLGEKVFNEKLTFCSDKNLDTNRYACFFDDEGEIAPDNFRQPLIKNGVFTNVLTCKGISEKFNLPEAATASAAYDGVPDIGYSSSYVEPTAKSVLDITKGKAVLLIMAQGGDMTPDGHFATPVQLSYLVENGEIVGKLPDLNISGDFFQLLGDDYLGTVDNAFFPSMKTGFMSCKMKVTK